MLHQMLMPKVVAVVLAQYIQPIQQSHHRYENPAGILSYRYSGGGAGAPGANKVSMR